MRKKYFYDMEFIEDGETIDLLSIGVVCEDGREFYAQNTDCRLDLASDWVKENVFPHLQELDIDGDYAHYRYTEGPWEPSPDKTISSRPIYPVPPWMCREEIRDALLAFVGDDEPEWWGYYSAYDHVALCQLFGKMIDLPKGWPFYTKDLKQFCVSLGDPDLRQVSTEGHHSALYDARWNKRVWEKLDGIASLLRAEREEARETIREAHALLDRYGIKRQDELNEGGGIFLITEYPVTERIRFAMEVPGELVCPTCSFRLHKRLLSAVDFSVSVDSSPVTEHCPNDGAEMRPLTWKESDEEANRGLVSLVDRLKVVKDARERIAEVIYSLDRFTDDTAIAEIQDELNNISAQLKERAQL